MSQNEIKNKQIRIVKVVSKNFIKDFIASIQNFLGLNLTSYEDMIDNATKQIQEDINNQNITLQWYRYEITQLTNGAMAVVLYGDKK